MTNWLNLDGTKDLANPHKHWIPRGSVIFSPRVVHRSLPNVKEYIDLYMPLKHKEHGAFYVLGWHYLYDDKTNLSWSREIIDMHPWDEINIALPNGTRNPAWALVDEQGIPIHIKPATQKPDGTWSMYYSDSSLTGFRNHTESYLHTAVHYGATSFHYDSPYRTYWRWIPKSWRGRCYHWLTETEVKVDKVDADYTWLKSGIEERAGDVPLTGNLQIGSGQSSAELMPAFGGIICECQKERNWPLTLYTSIEQNLREYNRSTATILVDNNEFRWQRHIATVYALGGHAVIPYDTYIGKGIPRYTGDPFVFMPYYRMVTLRPELFNGLGLYDAHIRHWRGRNIKKRGKVKLHHGNAMAALRRSSKRRRAVLHVVNWQVNRIGQPKRSHDLKVTIDLSALPFLPATTATSYRPNGLDNHIPVTIKGSKLEITVPAVDVWAMVKFKETDDD